MKKTAIAIFMLVVSAANSAVSQDGKSCAAVDDAGERLLCYDGVFRVDRQSKAEIPPSKWQQSTAASKIDDSQTVFLFVMSDDTFSGKYGDDRVSAELYLRCYENKTSIILTFGNHFMADSGGFGEVTFRIDNEKAFTRSLVASTDHKALGLWEGGKAIPFIKALLSAKKLTVRATPYSESPITTTFTVAGLSAVVDSLRKACGW